MAGFLFNFGTDVAVGGGGPGGKNYLAPGQGGAGGGGGPQNFGGLSFNNLGNLRLGM